MGCNGLDGRRVDSFVDDVVVDVCGSEGRRAALIEIINCMHIRIYKLAEKEGGLVEANSHSEHVRTKVLTPFLEMRMYRRRASEWKGRGPQ